MNDTCLTTTVEDQFSIMNHATICLSNNKRDVIFNDLCHTLHKKWNIKNYVLGDLMGEYGFEYKLSCHECDEEYKWNETCSCGIKKMNCSFTDCKSTQCILDGSGQKVYCWKHWHELAYSPAK